MTEPGIEGVIDHQADLQRQLDRIDLQVGVLALAAVAIGVALTLIGWQLWRA